MKTSLDDFYALMKPGSLVYVGGSSGEPRGLLDAIASGDHGIHSITYLQFPLGAINRQDLSKLTPDSKQLTFFMSPHLRDGVAEGSVEFIPMHMRTVYDYLARADISVALLQAARDADGRLRFVLNVDFLDAVLGSARHIAVEENSSFVAPPGAPLVDESRIDVLLNLEGKLPVYPVGERDEVSNKIGELIASLIRDGDCLQTGLGAIPAAILSNLDDRNDLGFHGGLIDDGVMALIKNGNLSGTKKEIDHGLHILGMALGSREMIDWLAGDELAKNVVFRSANYTHEARVIAQLSNFVSVNSAVEIDLMGQINAEVAGGKQISGTGGSVDFMRAAKMSKGGRSIVAMVSTARGGTVSRIVPRVEVATALRTDIDIVVTEFGIAKLKDAPLKTRADSLIEIAHPDFRDELKSHLS